MFLNYFYYTALNNHLIKVLHRPNEVNSTNAYIWILADAGILVFW